MTLSRPSRVVRDKGLISIQAMGLPLAGAFFAHSNHRYFKSKDPLAPPWHHPLSLANVTLQGTFVYIISGDLGFVKRALEPLPLDCAAIVSFETRLSLRFRLRRRLWADTRAWLESHGFSTVCFPDKLCGGATDADYFF